MSASVGWSEVRWVNRGPRGWTRCGGSCGRSRSRFFSTLRVRIRSLDLPNSCACERCTAPTRRREDTEFSASIVLPTATRRVEKSTKTKDRGIAGHTQRRNKGQRKGAREGWVARNGSGVAIDEEKGNQGREHHLIQIAKLLACGAIAWHGMAWHGWRVARRGMAALARRGAWRWWPRRGAWRWWPAPVERVRGRGD